MDCIKSRPLPTAQCTPGHPCPKPSDSFSRATTAAFPRRAAVFLSIGEQRKQRRCLLRVFCCFKLLNLNLGETAFSPRVGLPSSRELFDAKLENKTYRIITQVYE
ncbi:unnamed protein product [Musa acuminata var. zebrina]